MRLFLFSFLFCVHLHAWEISQFRGEVKINKNGQWINAVVKQQLSPGNVIKTGRGAKVLLTEGDSKLWLGQNTAFKLKPSEKNQPSILQTIYGKMRTIIAPKQAEQYRYEFKTVVAGVRGTEFFAQSTSEGDRLCTLEGEIEVEQTTGEKVIIPAGKGVLFSEGEQPSVSDNSTFLVDRWVAETSLNNKAMPIESFYGAKAKKHALGSNFYWGFMAWAAACDLWNGDFRNLQRDSNKACASTYISPYLQYGKKHRIFVRPALNTFWTNQTAIFDHRPTTRGRQQETLTLAEGFVQSQWDSVDAKAGYQDIQWNEGILISNRRWSFEPMTYLALRTKVKYNDLLFDIIAIDGDEKNYALDGINQISMLGVKVDLPKHWGNFYYLYAKYPGFDSPLADVMQHGRELSNFGFYRKAKKGKLDYKVSTIYQKHTKNTLRPTTPVRSNDQAEGLFFDLEWGWTISTKTPVRFSYRGVFASKDFAPIQNDYYILGISPLYRYPSNISQLRAKFEWQFMTNQLLYIEYLNTDQLDKDGFVNQLGLAQNDVHMSDEIDLVYNGKICDSLNGFFGLFIIFPGSAVGPDPASGLLTRLEYNF